MAIAQRHYAYVPGALTLSGVQLHNRAWSPDRAAALNPVHHFMAFETSRGIDRRDSGSGPLRVAVIVTTYNRPDALVATLRGLLAQDDPNFEVVVADDGSGAATAQAIAELAKMPAGPGLKRLLHAWQPDQGFRASAVRNLGVSASQADYLIFLDGDCVPRHDFVRAHRELAQAGFMVTGSRVLLTERLTKRLLGDAPRQPVHGINTAFWLGQRLLGGINKILPLARLPDGNWRHYREVKWRRIKSCNLSMSRADYLSVNGFDETFVGWGHEDADLVLRLARKGLRRKGGAFATEVFHLWHKDNTRVNETANYDRVMERFASGLIEAPRGLADHPQRDEKVTTVWSNA